MFVALGTPPGAEARRSRCVTHVASEQMAQQPATAPRTSRLGLSRPMALILFTVFLDLLGIGLIFPIGPFLGGFLGQYDLRLPAFAAAALVVVNWISVLVWLPESLPVDRRSRGSLTTGLNPFGVLITLL